MKKILLISIDSIHIQRWIENLNNSSHFELYWFDILCRGKMDIPSNITQIVNWKKRKIKYIKGEYFLRKKLSSIYLKIQPFFETTIEEQLEKIIKEIKPDVVHSFEMQSCSYPILKIMIKYPKLNWIYSCWGSDLYFYQKFKNDNKKIRNVLNRIDFLHTDCLRDYKIADKLGFKGEFLGVIPGGAGFKLSEFKKFKLPIEDRNIILVKGYEHKFGRALNVIKALSLLSSELKGYEIVIFGAHKIVIDFIVKNKLEFKAFDRNELSHIELMELMGKSKIYIGNSISDGMPNTLLEAIVMGTFPIQSNPGNATSEIIEDGVNGFLISNPDDIENISKLIRKTLKDKKMISNAEGINRILAKEKLAYAINQEKIIALYQNILNK